MLETIVIALISGFVFMLIFANEFRLSELDLRKFKKSNKPLTILSLFPHPDDEINIGGTLARYVSMPDTKVMAVSITRGEAGETHGLCDPKDLGQLRSQEFAKALAKLDVSDFQLWDFPDGSVSEKEPGLRLKVEQLFHQTNPDVVITYDSSGMYGHPDHIVLSNVVTDLVRLDFPQIKLLYLTAPARVLKMAKLPTSIDLYGKRVDLQSHKLIRSLPKYKISVWRQVLKKYRAMRMHKSQNFGQGTSILTALYAMITVMEHYSEPNLETT